MDNNSTTQKTLGYNFIAVPTNLFFALDNNLRSALSVLLQLSSVYADTDGYFFRTNEDLQQDFKMGKNLTIAVLESLYQYGLLQVKSVGFTKKNGKKQVNFFRVNVEAFKDFEKYHIYTITKNEELHLNTVDYKAKGFSVTYTANTEYSSTDVDTNISEEIPSNEAENATEAKETAKFDTVDAVAGATNEVEDEKTDEDDQDVIPAEEQEQLDDLLPTSVSDDCPLLDEELEEFGLKVPKVIETACVIPTDLSKVETRCTENGNITKKCYDLVNRYARMTIPNSQKSLEMCNQACNYIEQKFKLGQLKEEDKKRLIKFLIEERFKKHRI